MVTAPASTAWALVLALHGMAAPLPQAAPSSGDPQSVAAKPIDPSATRSSESPDAGDDQDARPLPPGVYRAGTDVSLPRPLTQVLPHYTSDAMRAQVQGVVRTECIVGVDGKVTDVRVVRSLDTVYGLDEAAVRAVKQWTFEPGKKDGVAVPVLVIIDSTFTMSPAVQPTKTRR
jgi:periplasmic protein TonB